MCGKSFTLAVCLLALSSAPCWAQEEPVPSFDPLETYSVSGATLNALTQDLLTARDNLASSETQIAGLTTRLTQLSSDFDRFKQDTGRLEVFVAVVAFLTGGLVGASAVLVAHR